MYCVDIQAHAAGALEGDNLRGERRWERQVARALLDAGRRVGSIGQAWGRPDTPLWDGEVRSLSGRVLIAHADPNSVRYRPGAEAFVSNVFCGLGEAAEQEIRHAVADMGRTKVALTRSFQTNSTVTRIPQDLQ